MIVTPARRIMLTETQHGRLEVLVLGEPDRVALAHAAIKAKLESWPGWQHVGTLVMGTQAIGLRADVSTLARHLEPIAEFHRMRLEDRNFLEDVRFSGALGEW